MDFLWILNLLNLAIDLVDLAQSQVLDGGGEHLLFESVSAVGLLILDNVQDGVLLAVATTGKEASVDGAFPEGSQAIVTEAVEESSGGGVGEDWLVLAGGEVNRFHDLVDLIALVAELLESPWPWEFSLDGFVAVFSGS